MNTKILEKALTVIIAFRDEGVELIRTLDEIKRTADKQVDIILIDDASHDNYNYEEIATEYEAVYLKNKERLGCAPSRDLGINVCKTPYFIILDAHMRFYDNTWWQEVVRSVKTDERAIYCCKCRAIDYVTGEEIKKSMGSGAVLHFFQP